MSMDTNNQLLRYGIMQLVWANLLNEDDPYGVEVDFFDKQSKQQGRVKLIPSLIPTELLTPINEALNGLVAWALSQTAPVPTDYIVAQGVGEPYPEAVLQPGRLQEHNRHVLCKDHEDPNPSQS